MVESFQNLNNSYQKKNVIIVDDIRTDLQYLNKLVTDFGHEVTIAESAVSALEKVNSSTGDPPVVI